MIGTGTRKAVIRIYSIACQAGFITVITLLIGVLLIISGFAGTHTILGCGVIPEIARFTGKAVYICRITACKARVVTGTTRLVWRLIEIAVYTGTVIGSVGCGSSFIRIGTRETVGGCGVAAS